MREIKFRAWDKENNKFFKPTYEAYKGNLEDLSISLSGQLIMRTIEEPAINESLFPDRFVLQQFTGLKDRNGVEIYDGDIIKKSKRYFIVKWFNNIGCFNCVTTNEDDGSYPAMNRGSMILSEVVGNIYENPEYTGKLF